MSCGLGLFSLARLLQVYGREHMLPPAFAKVHNHTGVPLLATLVAGGVTGGRRQLRAPQCTLSTAPS